MSRAHPLRVFLDCEFTSFGDPQLLSMGLVSEHDHAFYGELPVPAVREDNPFVDEHVLSQWGRMPTAFETPSAMAAALEHWLLSLESRYIEVHYDYHKDMDLLEALLQHDERWKCWEHRLIATHVGYLYGDDRVEEYVKIAWEQEALKTGLYAHHALADARVLRSAFLMVHSA